MCMSEVFPAGIDVICITNRHLVSGDFLKQLRNIASRHPKALVLREKDLPEPEYEALARHILPICGSYQVPCILHTYQKAAIRLGAPAIHLPLPAALALTQEEKSCFSVIGVSTHSVREAQLAQAVGATYLTASHIFATDCKKGLAPKGVAFLQEMCEAVQIPVYALGGVNARNAAACIRAGAAGVCVMSACMRFSFS